MILRVAIVLLTCLASGAEYHVTTNGTANGTGSLGDPMTLAKALGNAYVSTPVTGGDIVWVHGGTYGILTSVTVAGALGNPVTVRNWNDERAIILGTTTNKSDFCLYTQPTSAFVNYWGLEFANSNPDRAHRADGLRLNGPTNKIINCIIHDVGTGIGCWDQAMGLEVYGCLIYFCGEENPASEGMLHGIYGHSTPPGISIHDNIVFNNYGMGIQCYSDQGELLSDFDLQGNTSFDNGKLNTNGGYASMHNFMLGGTTPMTNLVFRHNYSYMGYGYSSISLGFTYAGAPVFGNKDADFQHNYSVGGRAVSVIYWTNLVFANNTFVGLSPVSTLDYRPVSPKGTYLWETNTYQNFGGWTMPDQGIGWMSFNQFRDTNGFDLYSTSSGNLPSAEVVFIRTNKYQNRFVVTVFNWSGKDNITVVLPIATNSVYTVRNAQNYFYPLQTGVYNGSVSLPMTNLTAATPATASAPGSPAPVFNAFVIEGKTTSTFNGLVLNGATIR